MNLHNTMEDVVLYYLEDILKEKNDICKCEQCKMDMACYVLNRIYPRYIISSRGVIHCEKNRVKDNQNYIDIFTIVMEAISVVSKSMRHSKEDMDIEGKGKIFEEEKSVSNKFYYNFPQIVGRLIDSTNLEPISEAKVTLHSGNRVDLVKMINNNWKNPVYLDTVMEGFFSFWPYPIVADTAGEMKEFLLYTSFEKDGYEKICKSFEIKLTAVSKIYDLINHENVYHLNEIYLYPEGLEG